MNQSPLECPAQFMFDARRRTLPSWKGPSAGELSTPTTNNGTVIEAGDWQNDGMAFRRMA